MRRMTVAALAAAGVAWAVVCPASADTRITVSRPDERAIELVPTPTFGTPTHDGRVVRSQLVDDKLVIELAGSTKRGSDVELPFTLPSGTRVTALKVVMGKQTWQGEMFAAGSATTRYHDAVYGRIDPALLEQTWSGKDGEHLSLHVSPITARDHAIVEITLARSTDEVRAIGDFVSLYAAPPGAPPLVLGCDGFTMRYLDKRIIRDYVQLHEPQLTYCYERALLAHPKLAGTAELHFSILSTGAVENVSVDGTLEDDGVRQCIANEVATWAWSPTDDTTKVNYPISFVPVH